MAVKRDCVARERQAHQLADGLVDIDKLREGLGAFTDACLHPRHANDERHARAKFPVSALLPHGILAQMPAMVAVEDDHRAVLQAEIRQLIQDLSRRKVGP